MAISSTGERRGRGPSTRWRRCSGSSSLFLYGPMLVIYMLSFQGPHGGVTFPMVGFSLDWFHDIFQPGQMANIPVSFARSMALAAIVSLLTVVISVAAGLAFRRPFPGLGRAVLPGGRQPGHAEPPGRLRHRPRLQVARLEPILFTSALGAQLTWTLPFGLFAMFAVVNRFNRAWEEAANDLGASSWQRLRYVTLPILLPGIIGVAMARLHAVL